jgi:hypothetical protein
MRPHEFCIQSHEGDLYISLGLFELVASTRPLHPIYPVYLRQVDHNGVVHNWPLFRGQGRHPLAAYLRLKKNIPSLYIEDAELDQLDDYAAALLAHLPTEGVTSFCLTIRA